MSQQDYSWIKPGVLAITTKEPNSGAVVEVTSMPYIGSAVNTYTGRATRALRVDVNPVTPILLGPHATPNGATARCAWLRPLPDFTEEDEVAGISVKEPIREGRAAAVGE